MFWIMILLILACNNPMFIRLI
ncbi:hypothetical protein Goshw_024742 [Gossypium schwendimanii]|nr:hypothetical protein [Gossypium schwendimanii]